jgi:hypothetical protein
MQKLSIIQGMGIYSYTHESMSPLDEDNIVWVWCWAVWVGYRFSLYALHCLGPVKYQKDVHGTETKLRLSQSINTEENKSHIQPKLNFKALGICVLVILEGRR